MLSSDIEKKIDQINLEEMLDFDEHNRLLEEFLAAAKEKEVDLDKIGPMAEKLTDQCNKISAAISTMSEVYDEDPAAMNEIIHNSGLPFFWNVMEELSRSMQLELTLISIALGEAEHRS